MALLTFFLVFLEIVICLLLIGVILLQRTKGGGAGLAFGAGMGESLFGAEAGTVLTKATVVLGVAFLLNTTLLAYLGPIKSSASVADRIRGSAVVPTPGIPAQQPEAFPVESGGENLFGTEALPVPADAFRLVDQPAVVPPPVTDAADPVVVPPAVTETPAAE